MRTVYHQRGDLLNSTLHAVNVSILWSAVIWSNGVCVSGQAVTHVCAHTHTHTHTHRDSACVTLPIPGHCLNKMLYPCAICSMLYLWQEMYLITFFLAIRPRLTRALRLRWQERFASMCREQRRRSYSVRSRPGGENAPRPSPAYPSSSSVFRATRKCNEPSWNAGRIWGAKIRNLCVQMPKHTRDIRCALKEGPVCLISTPPTWKNGC